MLAQGRNYRLILIRIASEDVANHDDSLLYNVRNFCRDKLEQNLDALARGGFDLDGELSNGPDCLADKMEVDLRGVFFELDEDLMYVLLISEREDELEFGDLDVYRVIVLAKEDANLVSEDLGMLLEDE